MRLTSRFSELFEQKTPKEEDNRTLDEIVDGIWSNITGKKAVNT